MNITRFTVRHFVLGVVSLVAIGCASSAKTSEPGGDEPAAQTEQAFGDTPCLSVLEDGGRNPDWPGCKHTGPSIPGPSCAGDKMCYCFCRVDHPCATNASECNALSACLTGCDHQYPTCPYPGSSYPKTRRDCI